MPSTASCFRSRRRRTTRRCGWRARARRGTATSRPRAGAACSCCPGASERCSTRSRPSQVRAGRACFVISLRLSCVRFFENTFRKEVDYLRKIQCETFQSCEAKTLKPDSVSGSCKLHSKTTVSRRRPVRVERRGRGVGGAGRRRRRDGRHGAHHALQRPRKPDGGLHRNSLLRVSARLGTRFLTDTKSVHMTN